MPDSVLRGDVALVVFHQAVNTFPGLVNSTLQITTCLLGKALCTIIMNFFFLVNGLSQN